MRLRQIPFLVLGAALLLGGGAKAQGPLEFHSLDGLFAYADSSSRTLASGEQQSIFARLTELAAKANVVNLRGTVNWSETDNLNLPVTFLPGEIFGGAPGSVREIRMGQQFVGLVNIAPSIDVINPGAWGKLKSATVNTELTEVNNALLLRTLHESIAAAYYNITSLQKQMETAERSVHTADSILLITQSKYNEGLLRLQDVNNAHVNLLNVKDLAAQISVRHAQQVNNLRILLDVPVSQPLSVATPVYPEPQSRGVTMASSHLQTRQGELQEALQRAEWKAAKLSLMPTVSLVGSINWQKNSNARFWDSDANWITSQYIGLRVSVPFPPETQRWSQVYLNRTNFRIAQLNADHAALQEAVNNEQINLDRDKAQQTWVTQQEIASLKRANYTASFNIYQEGLISTDQLLTAFSDLLSAELNALASEGTANYTSAKISIYNSIH